MNCWWPITLRILNNIGHISGTNDQFRYGLFTWSIINTHNHWKTRYSPNPLLTWNLVFRYRHQPKLISHNWNFEVEKVSLKTAASEQRNFCTFHRGTLRNGQSKFRITQKGDLRAQKVEMIRVQKNVCTHIYFYNDGKTTIQYHKTSNKICNKWICCVKPRWFAFSSKGSFAVSYNFLMMYPIDVYNYKICLIYYLPLK